MSAASFQSLYNINMPIGIPGQIADCGFKNTLSPVALELIPPAVGVMKPLNVDYAIMLPRNDTASVVISAPLVTGNVVNVTVNGVALTPTNFVTDSATTMQAIATKIQATVPTVTSATAGGPGTNTITVISNPGTASAITGFVVTGGASQATGTVTASQSGTFFGVSQYIYNRMNLFIPQLGPNASISSAGAAPYYLGDVVPTLTQGRIYVVPETVVTSNSPVYLRVVLNGASTALGNFRGDADSGNAILIPATSAIWREGNGVVGGIAVLELGIL